MANKVRNDAVEALQGLLFDGMTIMAGGFGLCGIPENLIAKVRILKTARNSTQSLPKAALLTDETESDFWVMKLLDSTTAVKVFVKKGIETKDKVEILSPVFSPADHILVSGNYGLPDTAKVKVGEALQ